MKCCDRHELKIYDLCGNKETLCREEGLIVFKHASQLINQGGNLCLDFTDIDLITGAFFNPLVSKLIKNFGEERANQVFNDIINLSKIDRELLNKTIKRVKKGMSVNCCGSCYYFNNEGINGDGICDFFDKMKLCSDPACSEWEENKSDLNIKPSEVF